MRRNCIYYKILLIMTIFVVILSGCNGNPNSNNNSSNNENKMPEAPDSLLETEDMIRELIYDVDAVAGIEKAIEEKEKNQQEISAESDIDMGVDEKDETAERDVNLNKHILENSILIHSLFAEEIEGHAAAIEVLPGSIDEIWHEIDKRVGEIHNKWNVVERELKKVQADDSKIQQYESLFDETTIAIKNRSRVESLNLLNELTFILGEFRGYFKHKVPNEVVKMTAHNRRVVLLAYNGDYEKALAEVEETKELLNAIRNRLLERDAEDVIQKLELSLEDLERELKKENFYLTQLKAAVVIKNTKLVTDVFESVIKE